MAGGTTNVYKVQYHFEKNNKKSSGEYTDYVSAADNKYDTIATVLSNNNLTPRGGWTLVIDGTQQVGQTAYIA